MPISTLPHDVWLNVAQHIPLNDLKGLYPVNKAFLNAAFDARYRQISVMYWDDRLLRNLIRLSDPFVAAFVKILHLWPGFLKVVFESHSEEKEKEKEREKPRLHRTLQQLLDWQSSTRLPLQYSSTIIKRSNLADLPPRQAMAQLKQQLKAPTDVLDAVLDMLRSLSSLQEYSVTWRGPSFCCAEPLPPPVANIAIAIIGTPLLSPTLTKLSLDISLENVNSLYAEAFRASCLEHLDLHLHSDHKLDRAALRSMLRNRVARSVYNLAPHLCILSIETNEPVDIGPFFSGLPILPRLHTLSLNIPQQKPHLGNPKAFGRFIRRQSDTLKIIRLRATQHIPAGTSTAADWGRIGTPDPWSLHTWIRTVFGTEAGLEYQEWFEPGDGLKPLGEYDLRLLDAFEVGSSMMPLETRIYLAGRFGSRISSLGLMGTPKSFKFVTEMVNVLVSSEKKTDIDLPTLPPQGPLIAVTEESEEAKVGENGLREWMSSLEAPLEQQVRIARSNNYIHRGLRSLRLGTVPLSPQLLDLLAAHLPNLRHLELVVNHFLPHYDDSPVYANSRANRRDGEKTQLDDQIYEFLETLQNDWAWPQWKLETLAIYTESPALYRPIPMPLPVPSELPKPSVPPHNYLIITPHKSSSKGTSSSSSQVTVTAKEAVGQSSQSTVTLQTPIMPSVSASTSLTVPAFVSTSLPPPSASIYGSLYIPPFQSASTPSSPNPEPCPFDTDPFKLSPIPTPKPSGFRARSFFSIFRSRSKSKKEKEKVYMHRPLDNRIWGPTETAVASTTFGTSVQSSKTDISKTLSNRKMSDLWWLGTKSPKTKKRRRRRGSKNPISSFGSVSSGVSSASGKSEVSDVSSLGLDGDYYDSGLASGSGYGHRVDEETVTLEVALTEVLTRCLPGVKMVR